MTFVAQITQYDLRMLKSLASIPVKSSRAVLNPVSVTFDEKGIEALATDTFVAGRFRREFPPNTESPGQYLLNADDLKKIKLSQSRANDGDYIGVFQVENGRHCPSLYSLAFGDNEKYVRLEFPEGKYPSVSACLGVPSEYAVSLEPKPLIQCLRALSMLAKGTADAVKIDATKHEHLTLSLACSLHNATITTPYSSRPDSLFPFIYQMDINLLLKAVKMAYTANPAGSVYIAGFHPNRAFSVTNALAPDVSLAIMPMYTEIEEET